MPVSLDHTDDCEHILLLHYGSDNSRVQTETSAKILLHQHSCSIVVFLLWNKW